MARHLTPEEVKQGFIKSMGPGLGELYFDLYNELVWLHIKWKDYRELFGTDQETIDLLNAAAPTFFGNLQSTLFEDVLMHLSRLTDPARSVKKDNLTLCRLKEEIKDKKLRDRVKNAIQEILKRCDFARDWRNRRLAHRDLLTFRKQHPNPLAPASRRSVEEALDAMRQLMNIIRKHFDNSEAIYDVGWDHGGAKMLLHYISKGIKAEEAEQRKWK